MYDSYSYGYENTAALGAFLAVYYIVALVVAIFMLVCWWKIFVKAGKPGWGAIIPIYNVYLQFEIAFGNGLWFLLLLVPIANFVISLIWLGKFAKAYGHGIGFAIGLLFLPIIFFPILAFGSSTYQGPA